MKILLTGNPNVGKTTLFNALTGAHNRTGNYHGVTVGVSEKNSSKRLALGLIADLPGLYSLDGMSMEEKLAAKYIDDQKGDFLVVQVADAEHFKRSLKLTNSLLSRGLPVVLVLTMCKKFRARGGKLDCGRLSEAFGIRCIETDALRRKSVKALAEALKEVFLSLSQYREKCRLSPLRDKKFFSEASSNVLSTGDSFGKYFSTAYSPAPVGADKLTNLCLNAFFALPAFFALIGLVFFFTFGEHMPGVRLKEALEGLIERFAGFCGERIESPVVRSLVCDGFLGGIGSVLSFVPQIALMYLFLDFLEESGFMSALAFMTDGLFSKIGLSGRAAFSVLLGYGCTAAAIVSTRALEEKAIQKRAVACLYFVPCSAKLPVYLTLLSSVFENTFLGALLLYILGTGMGLAVAAFLKKDDSIFLMEIADICFPDIFFVIKKLLFQIKQFIIKISTTVLAFTLVVWFLSSFSFSGVCSAEDSFLAHICSVLKYAFYPMGITDWRAAFAAVSGLIAKENIAGMLSVLFPEGVHFSFPSACAYLTFIALIPPCISAIAACAGELGRKTASGYAALQTTFAFLCAYLVWFFLSGGAPVAFAALSVFGAYSLGRRLCKGRGKKKKLKIRENISERVYRG